MSWAVARPGAPPRLIGTGSRNLPRRAALPILVAAAVLAPWQGWPSGRRAPAVSPYGSARLDVVASQALQIRGDYVLLAGDSHVERSLMPELCGFPTLNLGIGGARAADVALALARLGLPRRPRLVVLSVGTNDIRLSQHPRRLDSEERFRGALADLIGAALALSPHVVVTDIPPVGDRSDRFDREAGVLFGDLVQQACARDGCTFVPLYRPTGPGAQEGALAQDGIHLRNYGALYRQAEPRLCGTLR